MTDAQKNPPEAYATLVKSCDVVSCEALIDLIVPAGEVSAEKAVADVSGTTIVAESLMRSFEVRKFLSVEFRRSKNGINWVANSNREIDSKTYLKVVSALNHVAINSGDLRYINTALKILDKKCPRLAGADVHRAKSLSIMERLASA